MKVKFLLFPIIVIGLVACIKKQVPEENEALIGGELFQPSVSTALISGEQILLEFTDGIKTVKIVTNDTIEGTYNITTESLKATALQANISYTDGSGTWYGTDGTVTIEKQDGEIEGSYDATLLADDENEIEINSGTFTGIEAEVEPSSGLIETEQGVLDSLESCAASLRTNIELACILDAVYSNDTTAPGMAWNDLYLHSQNDLNEKVAELWNRSYEIIDVANLVLASSEGAMSSEVLGLQVSAQARVIRSYCYLTLLKWFGGVPLITIPGEENIARSGSGEMATFIISDLQEALEYLPVSSTSTSQNWFPSAAARQMIARVCMYNEDYAQMLSCGQEIIYSNQYALSAETGNFEAGNPEIFNGFEKSEDEDLSYVFKKGDFIPVFRLTETYLLCSEALFMTGQAMEAMNYLNMVRMRRDQDPLASMTLDDLYSQYLTEFSAEGNIFNIMKIFNKAEGELQLESYRLLLPVPHSALSRNANLLQNPGY